MKFSEMLTEYLRLCDDEQAGDEWESIDRRRDRRERQAELLDSMDSAIAGVPAFDTTQPCQLQQAAAGTLKGVVPTMCPRCKNPHHACDAGGVPPTAERAREAKAREIYDGWKHLPGWVPWVEGGNSTKQDDARRIAARGVKGLGND